jgi:hypothetical protein
MSISGCVDNARHSSPDNHYQTIVITQVIEKQPSLYDNLFPNDQAVFSCSVVDENSITHKVHYKSDCEKVKVGQKYGTEHEYRNDYIILMLEE